MKSSCRKVLSCFLLFSSIVLPYRISHATPEHSRGDASSIAFATLGRPRYAFDIYSLTISDPSKETRLTDGNSINFNGYFASLSALPFLKNHSPPSVNLVYVTERNGSASIYLDTLHVSPSLGLESRSLLGVSVQFNRVQIPLVGDDKFSGEVSMKDRPSLVGSSLVYVSTHENPRKPRASWAAVYLTQLTNGSTLRLTPKGVADFSPAVSPSGVWTAVASYGEAGWHGDVQELCTDIYVFSTLDGSNRMKVIEHGGWPTWADDSTLYFHRRCDDGWWSVFRAVLTAKKGRFHPKSTVVERLTPPGLHAFTPAASVANKNFIAVATRRAGSQYRHIELFDVVSSEFIELTRTISPNSHHFNPFISPDSALVGYHKCRGTTSDGRTNELYLESVNSPLPSISLFRIGGSFPSFSPDGKKIAYVNSPGVYVMNSDGSGARVVSNLSAFSTAWDWKRKGVVYTSVGPTFASETSKVDIISINVDDDDLSYKTLTTGGENNAFPSASPDGKWVVFRSGRSGYKNLYIMDALDGEKVALHRLTEGPWSDTMCNWSPDGDWIAFASDREDPGSGSFELYKIHPNGRGLQKLIQSGSGGRANHPWFSPDGKYIAFTSDYAGVSAEPISNPHHYQPYGDLFVIKSDGSGIRRLTHNSYEDGTPTWGPKSSAVCNVELSDSLSLCSFEDCHWLSISTMKSLGSSNRQCAEI
ncbi:hypothetical protein F511_03289 [Dorcoceras hygrometricum]|uniref:Protein TolB n=1 Tax=Dorcoceras hygrometricum TaxID=472368 RepID=A0A2Z7BEZ2_9LAMI|nr:hypothetical protein F511_03289 [Dorcoceras hygrometricum]